MVDPNPWQTLLPSPTLEGSNKCGKENLSFPEQETETDRRDRPRWKEEMMPVFAAACFLLEHLPLLK